MNSLIHEQGSSLGVNLFFLRQYHTHLAITSQQIGALPSFAEQIDVDVKL
jgi:hypothetical protein